jgi:hypothetical protein
MAVAEEQQGLAGRIFPFLGVFGADGVAIGGEDRKRQQRERGCKRDQSAHATQPPADARPRRMDGRGEHGEQHNRMSCSAKAGHPVSTDCSMMTGSPLKLVLGPAEGRTRVRAMTANQL